MPKCGCKTVYQFDDEEDPQDDRLQRCAACGEVFDWTTTRTRTTMNDRPETQPGAPGFDGADLWNATVLGLNDVNKQTGLISRLQDEADLCRKRRRERHRGAVGRDHGSAARGARCAGRAGAEDRRADRALAKDRAPEAVLHMPALVDARNALAN